MVDNDRVGESDFGLKDGHNPTVWRSTQLADARPLDTVTDAVNTTEGNFDEDKFADTITRNAGSVSKHRCGAAVGAGFVQAGGDPDDLPKSGDAKDWGATLEKSNFSPVDGDNYTPQKGDIVVIQPYPGGNKSGHIAGFNGQQWISDFKQRDMWGGPQYRSQQPPYVIYRRNH